MVSPAASSSRNWSQVAHSGTSRELASSTLGAKLWVRNTPTGLPDWTSRGSSSPSRRRGATTRAKAPRPRAAPAVHAQVVGPLGDLGVEVVAEHPQGGLLLPAPAGQRRPPGGADDPCAFHYGSFPAGSPEGPGHLLGGGDQGPVGHQAFHGGQVGGQVAVLVQGRDLLADPVQNGRHRRPR